MLYKCVARRLLIFSALFLLTTAGYGDPMARHGGKLITVPQMHRLVVMLMPGSSLEDWSAPRYPHLNDILKRGAIALMNTRTARPAAGEWRESEAAAVATLSAGSRCAAPKGDPVAFVPDDSYVLPNVSASQLAMRRSLASPKGRFLICPVWSSMQAVNEALGYAARPGNLASSLSAAGIQMASVPGQGWSSLFASDTGGYAQDAYFLYSSPSDRCILVVDLGPDLSSADQYLANVSNISGKNEFDVLLISPYASDADYRRDRRLTPVALIGPNIPAGLLYSYSTRRPGLICNTDIAPTIAAWFGTGLQTEAFGRSQSIAIQPEQDGSQILSAISSDAARQRSVMQALPYFAIYCGIWLAVMYFSIFRAGTASVLPASAMLALLVSHSVLQLSLALPICLSLAYLLAWRFSPRQTLMAIAVAVLIIVTADGSTGCALMQRSALGYSPIEGARYYGIGNEVMGVYLAAALVVLDSFWRRGGRAGRVGFALLTFSVLVFMGTAGAKAGGIAVTTGMAAAYLYTALGGRWSAKRVAIIPVLGILATLLFAFVQMKSGAGEAHLGFSLQRVLSSGWSEVWSIASRKLAVELRLLWHSAWALPVWLGLASALYDRRKEATGALRASILMTTALTLLFNDAGAVAAALFLTFALSWQWASMEAIPATGEISEGRAHWLRAAFNRA